MSKRRSKGRAPTGRPQTPVWVVGAVIVAVLGIAAAFYLTQARQGPQAPWARLGSEDVHSLSFVGDGTDHLLFGHHGGLSETSDGGRTWQALPTKADAMAMQPASDGSIVIAGHEVFTASADGGETWQPVPADLPSLDIHGFARDPADPSRMWASLATGGLWESTDGGRGWDRVRDDNVLFPLAIYQGGSTRLLGVDINGLVASEDGGRTWAPLGTPPTYPMTALAGTQDGRLLYAGSPDGLFRSDDGGRSWEETPFNGSAFAIATSADGSVVAVVTRSTEFFRSSDQGSTWPGPTP